MARGQGWWRWRTTLQHTSFRVCWRRRKVGRWQALLAGRRPFETRGKGGPASEQAFLVHGYISGGHRGVEVWCSVGGEALPWGLSWGG